MPTDFLHKHRHRDTVTEEKGEQKTHQGLQKPTISYLISNLNYTHAVSFIFILK